MGSRFCAAVLPIQVAASLFRSTSPTEHGECCALLSDPGRSGRPYTWPLSIITHPGLPHQASNRFRSHSAFCLCITLADRNASSNC